MLVYTFDCKYGINANQIANQPFKNTQNLNVRNMLFMLPQKLRSASKHQIETQLRIIINTPQLMAVYKVMGSKVKDEQLPKNLRGKSDR